MGEFSGRASSCRGDIYIYYESSYRVSYRDQSQESLLHRHCLSVIDIAEESLLATSCHVFKDYSSSQRTINLCVGGENCVSSCIEIVYRRSLIPLIISELMFTYHRSTLHIIPIHVRYANRNHDINQIRTSHRHESYTLTKLSELALFHVTK